MSQKALRPDAPAGDTDAAVGPLPSGENAAPTVVLAANNPMSRTGEDEG